MSIIDKPIVKTLMLKGEKGDPGDLDSTAIVDNLTTNRADKVLSAKQGKVLKDLVDTNTNNISTNTNNISKNATNINNEISARQSADTTLQDNINSEATTRTNADSNLQSQINSLASGSPKGTYATTSALETANPDTGVYIVTSDGHIYSWTKNGSNAIDLGSYQSTGIADNSIEYNKLTNNLQSLVGITQIAPEWITGKGYDYNAQLNNINDMQYSSPILIKAGETIRARVSGYQNMTGIFVGYNENTNKYDCLLNSATGTTVYEYTAPQDIYIIITTYINSYQYCYKYIKQNTTEENYKRDILENSNYLITDTSNFNVHRSTTLIKNYDNNQFDKELEVTVNSNGTIQNNFNYSIHKQINIGSSKSFNKLSIILDIKADSDLPLYCYILDTSFNFIKSTSALARRFIDANSTYKRFIFDYTFASTKTLSSFIIVIGSNFTSDAISDKKFNIRLLGFAFDTSALNIVNNPYTIKDKYLLNKKQNDLGETISILGDSFSTYGGWTPTGYDNWYNDSGNQGSNNVNSVTQTWWYKLLKNFKKSLIVNCSYSGSAVSYHGYSGISTSTSFIERMKVWIGEQRKTDIKPSTIIIMGGTNDYYAGATVGDLKYSDWETSDFNYFAPSYCYMLDYLIKWNPQARIINYIPYQISSDFKNAIISACEHYNLEYLTIPSNVSYSDGHPNQSGMETIYNNLKNYLE